MVLVKIKFKTKYLVTILRCEYFKRTISEFLNMFVGTHLKQHIAQYLHNAKTSKLPLLYFMLSNLHTLYYLLSLLFLDTFCYHGYKQKWLDVMSSYYISHYEYPVVYNTEQILKIFINIILDRKIKYDYYFIKTYLFIFYLTK